MRKVMSIIICLAFCVMMAMPVSAAEEMPIENVIEKEEVHKTLSSNYFNKAFPELSSTSGNASKVVTITSGSISEGAQVTSISIYVRVSLGSSPLILYIQAPDGTIYSFVITKNGTITINDFNGFDPSGTWKIWIETQGTVSTISGTFKVNYSY